MHHDWREAELEELRDYLEIVQETGIWMAPQDLPMSIVPIL